MANNKKFITKNGLRTQNIQMASANNANAMELALSNADALTLAGDAGTLLTVNDTTTGNTLVVNGNILATAITAAITGNSSTATALQTARTINGTSFDGTANITTQTWGTSRDITIGSTTRSVNGSTNLTWSLADIGAAAASHTHTISDVTGLQTALDGKIASTEKGAANGVAPLGADSKIAAVYLPSYVDDVLEYANLSGFPGTGETGKIYVALDTNRTYRWSGTVYVEISPSPGTTDALLEGTTNLYFTATRARGAVVQDAITDAVTDRAPSQNAVFDALAGKANTTHTHSAADITSGTLAVDRGGTGIGSYTANNYIRALNATTLEQRTPAQVLADIGAAAASHTHTASQISDSTVTGRALLTAADSAAGRTALALGTAATANTGTSGTTVPLLDGNNTWSGTNNFSVGLGVGTAVLTGRNLNVNRSHTGATNTFGVASQGAVQSDVTVAANYFSSVASTQAASFSVGTIRHYVAEQATFGAGSSVTDQIGYFASSGLVGAANNYGFRGAIPAGSGRWNFFADGTADNAFAGNVRIGSTSAPTVALDVTGSGAVSGDFTVTGRLQQASSSTEANVNFGRHLSGATTYYNVLSQGQVQSSVTATASYFLTAPSTQAASFTLSNLNHYATSQLGFGAGSTVTTQNGFIASSTLVGATNNYGFRGAIPAGTGRWNLFMDGTADNHMAGALGIGTTALTGYNLFVGRTATGASTFYNIRAGSSIAPDVTTTYAAFYTGISTHAAAFNVSQLYHYLALQNSFGAGSSATNQYGFAVSGNLTVATNNYGFWSGINDAAGRWNFFANGTANNAFAGNVRIGSTAAPTVALDVTGAVAISTTLTVTGNATAADFIRPSDERLKKDISVLDAKKLLNPVRYKWIEDDKEDFGFLAGQVEEAYPEAVKTFDRDGITYKAVAYDKLTAVLAAQLNEAVEELRQLKARVESIEKAND